MNALQADEVNAQLLGELAVPGLEPVFCPACGNRWWRCRNRLGRNPRHDVMMRELAHEPEPGTLFQVCAILGPVLGTTPLTRAEGWFIDLVAHGCSVPGYHATCASAPLACWHGKIWHKTRSGKMGPCQVPGCECLMFVSSEPGYRAARVPAVAQ